MVSTQNRKVYVVLGMPRSGTSAIARSLKALGINLGEHLIPPRTEWNAKGYWEDKDVVQQINKKVLFAIYGKWESIKLINKNELLNDALQPLHQRALQLIEQRFGDFIHWGFKDPRTARVLPFWQNIFEQLKLEDHYIIALRNPLSSAHSFSKLTKIDVEKGLLLWLSHIIPAIDETQNKKRVVVSYDSMLANPYHQLERIKNNLTISHANEVDIDAYAKEFLDSKLKHYEFNDSDLESHPTSAIIPVGIKAYHLLLKVANDELSFSNEEFIKSWDEVKGDFENLYPIYCYIDDILKSNKHLERELRTIRKSLPWKMISPLRFIDDKLRAYRMKLRIKQKVDIS